jgi:hypothetical protein
MDANGEIEEETQVYSVSCSSSEDDNSCPYNNANRKRPREESMSEGPLKRKVKKVLNEKALQHG